ncbi:hypothetical protein [Fibrobacter sp.]|uniref:hypothetical protein n=1 Tax=Fibrobacter sp. TaxID=35828 RepID=UPI003890C6CE
MDGFTYIEDHFETTVKPRILEQYKESGRWQACLAAVVRKLQAVEDSAYSILKAIDFKEETPTGAKLDWIAGLINVKRFSGESDEAFFLRFESMCGANTAGTPDNVIYNAAILSGDPHPQYMDEAPATFIVYDGPRPVGDGEWEQGGHQLSRSQVRKLAPAGVLGLPGSALLDADDNYIVDAEGKLILLVADDSNIEREVLLADNLGNIVITPQSVPVRVKLTGPAVPTIPVIETEWNGVPVDAVRIKDLPDGADTNGYMVRDSDTDGTVKSRAMDEAALDELWDSTPAEGEEG